MRVGSESTLPYGGRVNGSRASFNLPCYVRRRALGGGIGKVLGGTPEQVETSCNVRWVCTLRVTASDSFCPAPNLGYTEAAVYPCFTAFSSSLSLRCLVPLIAA